MTYAFSFHPHLPPCTNRICHRLSCRRDTARRCLLKSYQRLRPQLYNCIWKDLQSVNDLDGHRTYVRSSEMKLFDRRRITVISGWLHPLQTAWWGDPEKSFGFDTTVNNRPRRPSVAYLPPLHDPWKVRENINLKVNKFMFTSDVQWWQRWWWWRWSSICKAHYAERLYCATCSGALWRGKSSALSWRSRSWAMDRGDGQAKDSRALDMQWRKPDVQTYRRMSWYFQLMRVVADQRRWRLTISDVRVQQSIEYCGTLPCRHRWTITPSLYWIRWGMDKR